MEHIIIAYPSSHEYWNGIFEPPAGSSSITTNRLEWEPFDPARLDYLDSRHAALALSGASATLTKRGVPDALASSALLSALSTPLHVLVPDAKSRRTHEKVVCHVWPKRLSGTALLSPEESRGFGRALDISMSTPEFTFLQAAKQLSFSELLTLGFSYCGTYAESRVDPRGFKDRHPLTTPERIQSFLSTAGATRGIKKARQAARHLLCRSGSPMETVVALLLSVPCRLGGYGLPSPELNYRIDIPEKMKTSSARNYFLCDLYWPDKKVIVEFNGKEWHSGEHRMVLDTDKINTLQAMGYTVVPIMYPQVRNEDRLDAIVRLLCQKLGVRKRPATAEQILLRGQLRDELLPRFGRN